MGLRKSNRRSKRQIKRRSSKKSKRKLSKRKSSKRKLSYRRKSKRVASRRVKGELPIYKPERGCTEQTTKKYTTRPGPNYPANLCRTKVKMGNDGNMYKSEKRGNSKVYRWYKIN